MEKKRTKVHALICIGLICLIWGGYFVSYKGIKKIVEPQILDFSWVFQLDSVENEGNEVVFKGFAFELDKNADKGAYEIVLRDVETEENYFLKMKYTERKDVNEYFDCEYDYLTSGFVATIKEKKVDLQNGNYEVLLKMDNEKKAFETGTYISKGNIVYANPLEFKGLDVDGTDLEKIVEDGVLRVYRPDCEMYVYQYGDELYWIAGKGYEFVDGNARLQFQLFTTQPNRLPEECVVSSKSIGELSFWFLDNEVTDLDVGDYRVAKKELSNDCSISKLQTGNWKNDGGWIWKEAFYPEYKFTDIQ